jgi:hypothetical protein
MVLNDSQHWMWCRRKRSMLVTWWVVQGCKGVAEANQLGGGACW